MSDFNPSLEYAGTSGHASADSSADATHHVDTSGITAKAQKYVLILAAQGGAKGVTVAEAREKNGTVHHGRVSAALTNLHIAGRLVALRERRGHCGIYVLPEFVNGREVRPYKPNRKPIDAEVIRGVLLNHSHHGAECSCGWYATTQQPSVWLHISEQIAEALS